MTAPGPGGRRTVVLVSGSGSNLQALIDRTREGSLDIDLVGVVSDRPGVLALERAAAAGIPARVVDYRAIGDRDRFAARLGEVLAALDPGVIVLAGFMRILPAGLVDAWLGRMLNVHPSLLPAYPGLDTYQRALAAGERWHGTTVHFVTPELDAGPGIAQYRVAIRPGETVESLRQRVQKGEHRVYPEVVGWVAGGRASYRDGKAWLDGAPLAHPVCFDEPAH